MRQLETQWWVIELPSEWSAEQEDDSILISDEDGVGTIEITTLQKQDGVVDDAEVRRFTGEVEEQFGAGEPTELAGLTGYYFEYPYEDEAVREWYLGGGDLLVLITYCCDADQKGLDDVAVDSILDTLVILNPEERDS